jgi:hypothetical protein
MKVTFRPPDPSARPQYSFSIRPRCPGTLIRAASLIGHPALAGLCALGTGCDQEPEGSCITSGFSTDFDAYGTYQTCQDHATASSCTAAGGQFDEGGGCGAFDLIHAITAN